MYCAYIKRDQFKNKIEFLHTSHRVPQIILFIDLFREPTIEQNFNALTIHYSSPPPLPPHQLKLKATRLIEQFKI